MEPFPVTKLRIPPPPHRTVHRARLIDTIEQAVTRTRLTLVAAPAGYGKSTLLSQWARASGFPVVWVSLDEGDNILERFFRYLLGSWERVYPGIRESAASILIGDVTPDMEAVLSAFINVADGLSGRTVFVLDDYHLIEEASIHRSLAFLLDHLPQTLHFVLACRREPPLPLAGYRARNQMLELRAEDLKFRPEETTDYLRQVQGLDLTQDQIDPLQSQLEGWIAGLQLAAFTLQRSWESAYKLVVSGRNRFIADYLNEDVLAPLKKDMQQFLLRTSILERLCGPLCDAVTGREDGQEMLETVERENLFLLRMDERREWFRYHRLFSDFLREALKQRYPDEVTSLHSRAGRWFLGRDQPEPAFHHALEARDVQLVRRVFEQHLVVKLLGGEITVAKQWIESLPEEWQTTYPAIVFARAGLLLVTGQYDASARCLDDVERLALAEGKEVSLHQARVTAMRCNIACFKNDLPQAKALADRALRELPDEEHNFRAGIYGALGDTYRRHGRWEEAERSYRNMLDFNRAPVFHIFDVHLYGALADLSNRRGRLQEAAVYWRKALKAIRQRQLQDSYPLPLVGWVYIRMAELLYEWNDLEAAWDHLSTGLQRAELGGDVRSLIAGYLIAGRLKLTEGELEAAADYLDRARPHVQSAQFSHWNSRFERFQLELWLAQDRLRAAVNWSDEMLKDASVETRPESEVAQLAMARVLIVKGDVSAADRALALIERLLQSAGEEDRMGVRIEALALQALARERRKDRAEAMISLEHALRLAEPEGYLRLFADLGLPMARLLQEARSRGVMSEYVEAILADFGSGLPITALKKAPGEKTLPEPLTDREQEILELLAAGLTNREIAEELVIAPGTVKKHAANIYSKLGVGGRTEAAARARELDLLQ